MEGGCNSHGGQPTTTHGGAAGTARLRFFLGGRRVSYRQSLGSHNSQMPIKLPLPDQSPSTAAARTLSVKVQQPQPHKRVVWRGERAVRELGYFLT